jgi:hypothetical protein
MSSVKHQPRCCYIVLGLCRAKECNKPATRQHEGKWYCLLHDPGTALRERVRNLNEEESPNA